MYCFQYVINNLTQRQFELPFRFLAFHLPPGPMDRATPNTAIVIFHFDYDMLKILPSSSP